MRTYLIRHTDGAENSIKLTGRDEWALRQLIDAGAKGCTSIDNPAPRWSAYVHNLRHDFGLFITTVHERHGGDFPGTHARYVLCSSIEVVEVRDAEAA